MLAGVGTATWLFCRKYKVGWMRTVDALVLGVTPGIFAVRFANFLNGELYGRVAAKGVGFAMQFPTDPMATRLLGLSNGWSMRDRELCIQSRSASARSRACGRCSMRRTITDRSVGTASVRNSKGRGPG